jgi:hypothetical protein
MAVLTLPVLSRVSRNLWPGSFRGCFSTRGVPFSLHLLLKKSWWTAMSVTVIVAVMRASPGRRGVPRYLSKVLAQVWLVSKSALQRNITQGRFSLQHVLSRQLDATPDHEGMRWPSEGAPKSSREIRFAELHMRAKLRDKHRTADMSINIGTHFACLPAAQPSSSFRSRLRDFRINLLPQQRGCSKYRAVNRLSVIKLTGGHIEQRDYMVYPFA